MPCSGPGSRASRGCARTGTPISTPPWDHCSTGSPTSWPPAARPPARTWTTRPPGLARSPGTDGPARAGTLGEAQDGLDVVGTAAVGVLPLGERHLAGDKAGEPPRVGLR